MEKVKDQNLIVSVYPNGTKSKTIELQREVYDKLNIQKRTKLGFGTPMSPMEFQNYLWVMNNCSPKEVPDAIAQKVKENSNGVVDAENILFLGHNVLPLNESAIELMFAQATEGKIINFSLYDGICFSKKTYKALGEPNMKDLFTVARKQKIPIITLTVAKIESNGSKVYSHNGVDLFLHTGSEASQEKLLWEKCEEILVRGMYEDRSIKH